MKTPYSAALALGLLLILPGCRNAQTSDEQAAASAGSALGAASETSDVAVATDPVVAALGGIELRASALIRSLEYVALTDELDHAAMIAPDWRENDATLDRLVDRALQGLLLDAELARLDIVPDIVAMSETAERNPALRELLNMPAAKQQAALARFDLLDANDIQRELRRLAGFEPWLRARFAQTPEEQLREQFEMSRDVATVELVVLPNRAPSSAVEQYVSTNAAQIEAYHADNPGQFRQQRRAMARVVAVPIPRDATAEQRGVLRAQLETLRDHAMVRGIEVVASEAVADATLGATAEHGWITPRDASALFTTTVGELTAVSEDRGRYWFGIASERIDGGVLPLDDELRRQIGRKLLDTTVIQPEVQARAQAILDRLTAGDDPAAALTRANVTWQTTPPFSRTSHGNVPIVGESLELATAIFTELQEPGAFVNRPILTEAGVVVVRLIERSSAAPTDWAVERERWLEQQFRIRRTGLWPAFVEEWSSSRVRRVSHDVVRSTIDAWLQSSGRRGAEGSGGTP